MKKNIFIFAFLTYGLATLPASLLDDQQEVFICPSKNGKKYHFIKTCRGLSNCQSPIKKISLTDAKRIGKTICGWED